MSEALYELRADPEKFVILEVFDEEDLDVFIDGFDGRAMADYWSAVEVRLRPEEMAVGQLVGDFLSMLNAVPILSARAVEALRERLEEHGELLRLRSEDGEFWAYNALRIVDLMDEERSDAEYYAPGRVSSLRHLVAKEPVPEHVPPIFRLPQWLKRTLVTQPFVDDVVAHGLTGIYPRRLT